MQTYLAGNAVALTISLVDAAGGAIMASAASYAVLNTDGGEVVALAPVAGFVATDTEVVITVAAITNTLAGTVAEVRTVRLVLTTDAGVVQVEAHYRITPASLLIVPASSFQTYGSALQIAADMVSVTSWDAAGSADRTRALLQARQNIGLLRFGVVAFLDWQWQSQVALRHAVGDINYYDAARFANLPLEFRDALKRAQVLEADFLLSAGPGSLQEKRDAGLTSDTVGESSQTFTARKPFKGVICSRALSVLAKFLATSHRLGRA